MFGRLPFLNFPGLASVLVACSLATQSFAIEAGAIKRDPFRRPNDPAAMQGDKSPQQPGQTMQEGEEAEEDSPVNLRAFIVDPKKPLVNIGGQIIEVGASLHGYTLVKVTEREATLMKNGRPIKLSIDGVAGQ